MSKIIRIGTRDSELALYQANVVKKQLEDLGHKTEIVPVKSTGDLVLNKPLYKLGITGVFTKTLDIAMLNYDIDIAVHSSKDVPTDLPEGIVQAAVIKRGNVRDTLVFKQNEEFLSSKHAVIATGSLRRKAQWLNRFPTHTIEDIRGNVNLRLQKLEDNEHWNATIFAAAGLGRIGKRPENAINLDWMIPAPAQGAIMITALEEDEEILAICKEINHEETEICTSIEREFLNRLEGGCTAPIGALAFIKDEEVTFEAVLLSQDGQKKIEVKRVEKLGEHHNIAKYSADYIIERGGKRLMDSLTRAEKLSKVYSTKSLTERQRLLVNQNLLVESSDFIKININRLKPQVVRKPIKNVIITSQNTVEALLQNYSPAELQFENIYCVGRRTKRLVEKRIGKVNHAEPNAKKLAAYLIEYLEGTEVTYFCSNLHLDTLPTVLAENNIEVNEVIAYETKLDPIKLKDTVEGVMFYSPSTVQSFKQENIAKEGMIAFCIGETTAHEASKHFADVRISKIPTVESVIELVNEHYAKQ
ncbi:hydroxymethylbilane synthase [Oceanihabitans sediminis]|uniref:Hydroxymethylbilane synthase n=1 Tax=Oceanihabitans sediminis TaxID=1812012 RepID=A0A368P8Y3_9FLAO|nr:hydroxymethylbilane synthase [Oceanihabitans sediminis]MDX1278083.1 hydroxymethylbilane synthase [Oceanihabitans sediminis]MDX1772912.1 hydroxymethylbilane synthase [Oceanihabitans sediminis]RBP34597.1 hydroxymethylbilane synthase [Oceanihabitans sediminis]RCU58259.1 hydroxymethylbilane synthase [Oceanihabitans sediminis]